MTKCLSGSIMARTPPYLSWATVDSLHLKSEPVQIGNGKNMEEVALTPTHPLSCFDVF